MKPDKRTVVYAPEVADRIHEATKQVLVVGPFFEKLKGNYYHIEFPVIRRAVEEYPNTVVTVRTATEKETSSITKHYMKSYETLRKML